MKKSMIARAAAVVCSIASLAALGIAATAQTDIPVENRKDELVADRVNVIAGQVQAKPGETVQFPVYIQQNTETGFAATGICLSYDEALTVQLKEDGKPFAKLKDVASEAGLSSSFDVNEEKHLLALCTMGQENATGDGLFFVVRFTVPENPTKLKYPVKLTVEQFFDDKPSPVPAASLDGYIEITGVFVTDEDETTEAVGGTTTAAIGETTTEALGETTTETTAVLTTTAENTTDSAAVTTTTTGAAAVTTTKAGTSGTSAAKTGDAGAGASVAGFMLAAAAAVAATKKKKDN